MLEQTAVVIVVDPGAIWVRAVENAGCASCGGKGCATRRLADLFRRPRHGFQVESPLPLRVGERIVVGIPDGSVLKGALWAYGLPLVTMLAGALLAHWLSPGDGSALAGLIFGGLVGAMLARRVRAHRPVVLRREGAHPDSIIPIEKGR